MPLHLVPGRFYCYELRFTARHKPVPRGNVSRLASDARRVALYCQGNHPFRAFRGRVLVEQTGAKKVHVRLVISSTYWHLFGVAAIR